jgi:hypothetical protein
MPRHAAPPAPTIADLQLLLGPAFAAYEALLHGHPELRPEWKYYGAKSGWTLKLFEKTRNLCFVMPRAGELSIAFVLGARAVELALRSTLPESIRQEIRAARTYAEGRGVRVAARTPADLGPVETLLAIKRQP